MMQESTGIPVMRARLDEERRLFASIAVDISNDEPTAYFAEKVIDAYERLDRELRSLEFAHKHRDVRS